MQINNIKELEFEVPHANPVDEYYDANDKCFVCSQTVDETPHPAFNLFLRDGFAPFVGALFQSLDSPVKLSREDWPAHGAGGRVSACLSHRQNIDRLQHELFEKRRISITTIENSKKLDT